MFPVDLVCIRHAQSEENLATKKFKKGDESFFSPEFRNRHSRTFRLTDLGIEQAKCTGQWIKTNVPMPFDGFFVSDFIRAKETAVYLNLPQARWVIKYELRERDQAFVDDYQNAEQVSLLGGFKKHKYGKDLFYSYPPGGGESIASLCQRIKTGPLHDLEINNDNNRSVVVVCHGRVMRALQLGLESLSRDDFVRLDKSKNPAERLLNCQIHWYTRRDPETFSEHPHFVAVRSVCVHGLKGDYGWRRIKRPTFSNEELMEEVRRYPCYLPE